MLIVSNQNLLIVPGSVMVTARDSSMMNAKIHYSLNKDRLLMVVNLILLPHRDKAGYVMTAKITKHYVSVVNRKVRS